MGDDDNWGWHRLLAISQVLTAPVATRVQEVQVGSTNVHQTVCKHSVWCQSGHNLLSMSLCNFHNLSCDAASTNVLIQSFFIQIPISLLPDSSIWLQGCAVLSSRSADVVILQGLGRIINSLHVISHTIKSRRVFLNGMWKYMFIYKATLQTELCEWPWACAIVG